MADPRVILGEHVTAFQGYFQISRYHVRYQRFAGGMGPSVSREVFERGHAVAVLPYDPVRDEVVLIEQFRIAPYVVGDEPWLIEIVAGIIEPGESLEEVARREAHEEAGLELLDLVPAMRFYISPGASTETGQLYLGRIDSGTVDGGLFGLAEEGEDIRVHVVPFRTALGWLDEGRINVATPIIALQWLALHRSRLRRQWGID